MNLSILQLIFFSTLFNASEQGCSFFQTFDVFFSAEYHQMYAADPDYRFVKHLSDVDCYEKEAAVFECQFNHDDAPITWFKDDKASFVENFLMFAVSIILFFILKFC